jgi:hypothetical protein
MCVCRGRGGNRTDANGKSADGSSHDDEEEEDEGGDSDDAMAVDTTASPAAARREGSGPPSPGNALASLLSFLPVPYAPPPAY